MAEETPTPPTDPTPKPEATGAPAASQAEQALDAAQAAVSSLASDAGVRGPGVVGSEAGASARPVDLPAFTGGSGTGAPASIDLLSDVSLQVKIELGRTRMLVEDVLRLADGAVVELDKLAGDPVDIYVNERHVARGEVLVLNDNFCVRINEILESPVETKQTAKQAG
ncbi:MAG: flagellar motor switch protein FliN [Phycisphaerae bacterium]|nr:flagellar motor switch protein FliN [Phycisphaerae bacterium]MBN8597054.1 flagellar motor switch protein FliN [Planctomycetota bacterium]